MQHAIAAEAAGELQRARSVLMQVLERWNHPNERRTALGPDLRHAIREGGTGPGMLSLPQRYIILLALERIDQDLGETGCARVWREQAQWMVPRDRLWTMQRGDGIVYHIGTGAGARH